MIRSLIAQKQDDRAWTLDLHKQIQKDVFGVSHTLPVTIALERALGEFGPQLRLEKHSRLNWVSSFGGADAPAGDPRRFLAIAGRDLGGFFGYKFLNATDLLIPTAAYFETALKVLRQVGASDSVALGFYSARSIISNTDLLTRFAYEGRLPIGERDYLAESTSGDAATLHDHSFHTGAIFIPVSVTRLAMRQYGAVIGFKAFVEQSAPELLNNPEVRAFFDHLTNQMAYFIDFGTGNFVYELLKLEGSGQRLAGANDIYHWGYDVLANSGSSPAKIISKIANGLKPGAKVRRYKIDTPLALNGELGAKIAELASSFVSSHAHDSQFHQGLKLNSLEFAKLVFKQKLKLEAAARYFKLDGLELSPQKQ